jgi:two-component system, NarL family, response regulator LiaR
MESNFLSPSELNMRAAHLLPMFQQEQSFIVTISTDTFFTHNIQAAIGATPNVRHRTVSLEEIEHTTGNWSEARPSIVCADLDNHAGGILEGVTLLKRRWPDSRVIVFTHRMHSNEMQRAVEQGAFGFVLKADPFMPYETVIKQALAGLNPVSASFVAQLFRLRSTSKRASESLKKSLTERELEVLVCLSNGHSYAKAAKTLSIGIPTIQSHIRNIYRKLEARSALQAIARARDCGIL